MQISIQFAGRPILGPISTLLGGGEDDEDDRRRSLGKKSCCDDDSTSGGIASRDGGSVKFILAKETAAYNAAAVDTEARMRPNDNS